MQFKFYVQMDGEVFGPYSTREILNLGLLDDILVTEESLEGEWFPAGQFDFASLLAQENQPEPVWTGAEAESPTGRRSILIDSLNSYVGSDRAANLNWRVLFTDVFKSHTQDEADEIFICGTRTTTPSLWEVKRGWPHPWLYTRVLLLFAVAYMMLWVCVNVFGNPNALPGMIVMGSFAFPIATLVLFVELNAWRNVSFFHVLKVFFVGGCASLVATLILFSVVPVGELDYIGAFTVGLVEELGKAVIVYLFVRKLADKLNILSGMVIGAAVGAGFAAFESAGYAMQPMMQFLQVSGIAAVFGQSLDPQLMLKAINQSIVLRGFMAPGAHVAWAAISGVGLVQAAKSSSVMSAGLLFNGKFLRLFFIGVILHGFWDCPLQAMLNNIFPFVGYIILIVLVWIVMLLLINMGLAEIDKKH